METFKKFTIGILMMFVGLACSMPFRWVTWNEYVSGRVKQTVDAIIAQKTADALQAMTQTAPTLMPPVSEKSGDYERRAMYDRYRRTRPCYYAWLVGESIPDGSDFEPGEYFQKSWSLRNVGSCVWYPDMRLVFRRGDQMEGPDSVRLNEYVEPGEIGTFTVELSAPEDEGRHSGYWWMQSAEGYRFAQVYVKIDVEDSEEEPTEEPMEESSEITGVELSASQDSLLDPCPVTVTSSAAISANGPGEFRCFWELGTGEESDDFYVTFDAAGTQTVSYDWVFYEPGTVEFRLYIMTAAVYGPLEYSVECTIP
jgi:hypothetical protein